MSFQNSDYTFILTADTKEYSMFLYTALKIPFVANLNYFVVLDFQHCFNKTLK